MHAILAIAAKDLRLLLRDKTAFFFVFIFPLLVGILFGYVFSGGGGDGPSGVKVNVVDADQTTASRAFIAALSEDGTLVVTPHTDPAPAEDQVRTGASAAVITIPKGFQESLRGVFTGEGASIDVAIDPARQFERGIIEGLVTAAGFRTLAGAVTDPTQSLAILDRSRESLRAADGVPPVQRALLDTLLSAGEALVRDQAQAQNEEAGDGAQAAPTGDGFMPIRVGVRSVARDHTRERSAFEITFPQASAWGIMGVVMGFGISIVTERSSGTLTRLLMAPITKWHVIGGKAVGCFLGSLMVQVVLFAVGVSFFGIRPGSWPLLALAVVSGCIGFVGVMMLLAVLGRTAAASEGIARATLIVLALVGGAGIPLMVMPPFMRIIASVSPFKWLILALEGALWRDFTVAEMVLPCGVLVAVGVVGFALGAMLFRDED
jgi:ABC-2 type transport system permease protein